MEQICRFLAPSKAFPAAWGSFAWGRGVVFTRLGLGRRYDSNCRVPMLGEVLCRGSFCQSGAGGSRPIFPRHRGPVVTFLVIMGRVLQCRPAPGVKEKAAVGSLLPRPLFCLVGFCCRRMEMRSGGGCHKDALQCRTGRPSGSSQPRGAWGQAAGEKALCACLRSRPNDTAATSLWEKAPKSPRPG